MTDLEQDIAELLNIHTRDRQAHFATDVQAAISFFDNSYVYVRDGSIQRLSPADLEPIYTDYFRGATFHEWDDLEPPIIHVSDDGSMAWMIRRFRIRFTKQEGGQATEHTSIYAGMTIYEKKEGRWLRVANTTTFAEK